MHRINLKGLTRRWIFSTPSIILYTHNFWSVLIVFLNHSFAIPHGWAFIWSPSSPCHCREQRACAFSGHLNLPLDGHLDMQLSGLNSEAFTCTSALVSPKLQAKRLIRTRFQSGVSNFLSMKKKITGLEVSNIKISPSSSPAFGKYFIQLDVKTKIKSCTIW